VLNSHDAIKEAFVSRGTDFADRDRVGNAQLLGVKDGNFSFYFKLGQCNI